jgi:hypothetical protein
VLTGLVCLDLTRGVFHVKKGQLLPGLVSDDLALAMPSNVIVRRIQMVAHETQGFILVRGAVAR